MLELILVLVVMFPTAWLISEFQEKRGARIALGICAIAMSFGVAWIVGSLDRLQSNIYFSEATKDLIQNTIIELENDRSDVVLTELRALRDDFRPTYETRDDYHVLVDTFMPFPLRRSNTPTEIHVGRTKWWSTPRPRPTKQTLRKHRRTGRHVLAMKVTTPAMCLPDVAIFLPPLGDPYSLSG